jgi:hypothetical protein
MKLFKRLLFFVKKSVKMETPTRRIVVPYTSDQRKKLVRNRIVETTNRIGEYSNIYLLIGNVCFQKIDSFSENVELNGGGYCSPDRWYGGSFGDTEHGTTLYPFAMQISAIVSSAPLFFQYAEPLIF